MSGQNTATDTRDELIAIPEVIPAMALKDIVLFPFAMAPLSVGRERSVLAVEDALATNRFIALLGQKDPGQEDPGPEDLYTTGLVAGIVRMLKLPDGRLRILVQGLTRAKVEYFVQDSPFFRVRVSRLEESPAALGDLTVEAFLRSLRENLHRVVEYGKQMAPEILVIANSLEDGGRLADLVAANLTLKPEEAQRLLETTEVMERLRQVNEALEHEVALLEMQRRISSQVQGEMDRSHREFMLRQQLKTIQRELGETDDMDQEIERFRERLEARQFSEEARGEAEKQLRRLRSTNPESAESSVIRTYLDWLTGLPWGELSADNMDLARARAILDVDHFNLDKVKQRILEFLAVRKLKPEGRGPILCFVGPPGVGKTSLGRSIARAMERRFVRLSLGGVHDEAEIRGHRRTYVGAMPGRILQSIHQTGAANPVFMLDEIDKLGASMHGDPAAALLEVLDPEQNHSFRDHYLDVAFDLSRVMFIATANITETILPAFLDRMEVIELSGYTEEEKIAIARRHLIPKQIEETGLAGRNIRFTEVGLQFLINRYTQEAGLRNLEREIGAICRKLALAAAEERKVAAAVTPKLIEKLLGPVRFLPEARLSRDRIGVATGLAWTPSGGDILHVEALVLPGKGELKLTGHLGEVMKESAQAALSFLRAHGSDLGIDKGFLEQHTFHIHVPAGAIPKDGPSAGITVLTALASVASGRPVRRDLAMTGEITLRGEILPVGGIKEKLLAALRAGIHEVVIPAENRRELVELPAQVRRRLRIHAHVEVHEVLLEALLPAEEAASAGPELP